MGITPAAKACGGFFCSNAAPVIQMGEQIAFGVNGNQVDVHVRIDYEGPSEEFSWVLPLPAQPVVSVSDQALFDTLINQTNPEMLSEWRDTDACKFPELDMFSAENGGVDSVDSADGGDTGSDGTGGVVVLDSGQAGPYDYHVVEAAPGAETGALFSWLDDNGYEQPEMAEPLVDYYSAIGFKFVAIRLQKDQPTGAIRPLRLRYESPTYACVPLRLTSIAAGNDMPITVWIFAKARAIPTNYLHVTINPDAFDWVTCGQPRGERSDYGFLGYAPFDCDYNALLSQAVDEAGGRAFVTEYAGDTPVAQVSMPWLEEEITQENSANSSDKVFFIKIVQLLFSFQGVDAVTSNALAQLPKDAAQMCTDVRTENGDERAPWDFYAWCLPDDVSFDRSAILEDIKLYILEPLAGAQSLFDDYPYTTRLTTTMSPSDMSLDPLFSFNPDLPPVANSTTAVIEPICDQAEPVAVRILLPDGGSKIVYGNMGIGFEPVDSRISEEAAGTIQIMSESGPPQLVDAEDVAEKQLTIEGRGPSKGRSEVEANESATTEEPTGTFGKSVADRVSEPIPADIPVEAQAGAGDGCTAAPFIEGMGNSFWILGLCLFLLMARRPGRRAA